MPNTLGVSADPDDLHEPLFTGFAEDPPTLFCNAPRLIHSLDLAAEDNEGEAYRDLLREIDRAFKSFDHMAVRHGWMAGAVATDAPVELAPAAIDLPAFVASTLSPGPDGYRVPIEWTEKLEGLAGFNRASGTVRLTDDPDRWRNADGQEVMYPGRSHPLTRRAIALARTAATGRVSVVRGHRLSLVITYVAEVGGRSIPCSARPSHCGCSPRVQSRSRSIFCRWSSRPAFPAMHSQAMGWRIRFQRRAIWRLKGCGGTCSPAGRRTGSPRLADWQQRQRRRSPRGLPRRISSGASGTPPLQRPG